MKPLVLKQYELQAHSNDMWLPVGEYPENAKKEAISLLKYKKKTEKSVKWRVVLKTTKVKKIA